MVDHNDIPDFVFNSSRLGEINFRSLYFDDINKLLKISDENQDDKECMAKIIYSLVILPNFPIEVFKNLSDDEILDIGVYYIGKESSFLQLTSSDKEHIYIPNKSLSINSLRIEFDKFIKSLIKTQVDASEFINKLGLGGIAFGLLTSKFFPNLFDPETINAMISYEKRFKKNLNDIARFNEYWDFLEEKGINIKEILDIVSTYNWFITPSIPVNLLSIFQDTKASQNDIDIFFINYFMSEDGAELIRMVNKWSSNSHISKHMDIINTCLALALESTHNMNLPKVIIPTLINQIDGIMTSLATSKGLTPVVTGRRFDWKNSSGSSTNREKWLKENALNEMIDPIDSIHNVLFNKLFQSAYYGQKLTNPTTFNRHKIAHGEVLDYGTLDNMIRAFMLIDFLSYYD